MLTLFVLVNNSDPHFLRVPCWKITLFVIVPVLGPLVALIICYNWLHRRLAGQFLEELRNPFWVMSHLGRGGGEPGCPGIGPWGHLIHQVAYSLASLLWGHSNLHFQEHSEFQVELISLLLSSTFSLPSFSHFYYPSFHFSLQSSTWKPFLAKDRQVPLSPSEDTCAGEQHR